MGGWKRVPFLQNFSCWLQLYPCLQQKYNSCSDCLAVRDITCNKIEELPDPDLVLWRLASVEFWMVELLLKILDHDRHHEASRPAPVQGEHPRSHEPVSGQEVFESWAKPDLARLVWRDMVRFSARTTDSDVTYECQPFRRNFQDFPVRRPGVNARMQKVRDASYYSRVSREFQVLGQLGFDDGLVLVDRTRRPEEPLRPLVQLVPPPGQTLCGSGRQRRIKLYELQVGSNLDW